MLTTNARTCAVKVKKIEQTYFVFTLNISEHSFLLKVNNIGKSVFPFLFPNLHFVINNSFNKFKLSSFSIG
jgi:hypothetical protein